MTLFQRRAFVALDEWLGIILLVYLRRMNDPLFMPILIIWVFCVYIVSYPLLWIAEKEGKRQCLTK